MKIFIFFRFDYFPDNTNSEIDIRLTNTLKQVFIPLW